MTLERTQAEPLLEAVRGVLTSYVACVARSDDLIAAMIAGDVGAVQHAVAAQTAAFGVVERAERRRLQAERGLARALAGADHSGPLPRLTTTALLARLPGPQAAELAQVRRELLHTLIQLQARQTQAGMLARGALAVLRRVAGPESAGVLGYGPRGDWSQPRHTSDSRPARLA